MRTTAAATAAVLAMIHATRGASAINIAPPPTDPPITMPEPTTMAEVSDVLVPPLIPPPNPFNPLEAQQVPAPVAPVPTPDAPVPTPNAQVASPEVQVTTPQDLIPTQADPSPAQPGNVPGPVEAVANGAAGAGAGGVINPPPVEQATSTGTATGPTPLLLKGNTPVGPSSTTETAPAPANGNANGNGKSNGNGNSGTTKPSSPSPTPSLRADSGDDDNDAMGSDYLDTSLSYACVCKDVRKVSLMSASDYCLSPAAVIGNKCGNAAVGEKGECPLAGAQPCQDTGHVLSNDSMCAFDKKDETFKCVASKEDLYIQKNGKKKKSSLNATSKPPSGGGSSGAASSGGPTALRVVLLVASLAVGLAAVA